ncbi:MAG: hypothetical protein K2Q26_00895 [Bdellovibrionales bacterium]|nr:hypothetical protein [Bdellovibrionales bacterium]
MKALAFAQFEHMNWTALGLIIFLCYFFGVVIWTSLKPNKEIYEVIQNMPFEGEDHE